MISELLEGQKSDMVIHSGLIRKKRGDDKKAVKWHPFFIALSCSRSHLVENRTGLSSKNEIGVHSVSSPSG